MPRTTAEYKAPIKPIWCPGCGDYAVLNALVQALAALDLDPKDVVVISGIGCSGRLPIFVNSYGFHGVHGRVLPTAMGVKIGNPKLTVIGIGGDGDSLAIGGGHFPHAARRNIDMTYLMLDNNIYGLTKGQASPTTLQTFQGKSSPYGVAEENLNPIALALAYDVSFVARGYAGRIQQLTELLVEGIRHKGFSFIHALSPCVVYNDTYEYFNRKVSPIAPYENPSSKMRALELWQDKQHIFLGTFYKDETRQPFNERIRDIIGQFPRNDEKYFQELIHRYA
jgi:2-oxoglutarate ferredoxin oxidoreductase subunit beta